jgi:hypothetical protein
MKNKMKKKIFILGCERSGSTWLANIFDSHPEVELLMEPFADYANIFPGFPGRNVYLDEGSVDYVNIVKAKYDQLNAVKYPLFYKPGRSIYWKYLDKPIVKQHRIISRLLGKKISNKYLQYQLLNLNTSTMPVTKLPWKNKSPHYEVTKELRLNFKIGYLSKTFPNAVYIVIIRHPGAQITSITELLNNGNLGELKRGLESFVEKIKKYDRFKKYLDLLNVIDWENDFENKLIIWWLINYEVLIDDLSVKRLNYKIISHEELSENTFNNIEILLKFCDLKFDEQVKTYINASSRLQSKIKSPLDTNRDSAKYYKKKIAAIDPKLNNKIQSIISILFDGKPCNSDFHAYLSSYSH